MEGLSRNAWVRLMRKAERKRLVSFDPVPALETLQATAPIVEMQAKNDCGAPVSWMSLV